MEQFLTDAQIWAMAGVCMFMSLDIVSGFIQAVINRCLNSTKMREGILHKVSIALVVVAVCILEVLAQHVAGLSIEGLGTVPVCVIIILMELVSIWENACKGYPALRNSPLGRLLDTATDGKGASGDSE